jgi:hypothetical protein
MEKLTEQRAISLKVNADGIEDVGGIAGTAGEGCSGADEREIISSPETIPILPHEVSLLLPNFLSIHCLEA